MKKSKFKRITSFVLSVIICSSFCFAGNTVYAEWHEFLGNHVVVYFYDRNSNVDNDSYAEAYMDHPGGTEDLTDLEATTAAHCTYYGINTDYVYYEAYVSLAVSLDDNTNDSDCATATTVYTEPFAYATVYGSNICGFDQAVESFTSYHEIMQYRFMNGELFFAERFEKTIYISTSS